MAGIILAAFLSLFSVEHGQAAYYSPGVFKQVVAIRQAGWTAGPLPQNLPPVIGFIARPNCSEIGQLAWLYWENGDFEGPFLVADCCNTISGDCKRMKRRRIIAEVDYNTAKRRSILDYGPEHNRVILIMPVE